MVRPDQSGTSETSVFSILFSILWSCPKIIYQYNISLVQQMRSSHRDMVRINLDDVDFSISVSFGFPRLNLKPQTERVSHLCCQRARKPGLDKRGVNYIGGIPVRWEVLKFPHTLLGVIHPWRAGMMGLLKEISNYPHVVYCKSPLSKQNLPLIAGDVEFLAGLESVPRWGS